jgi:GR25 family glycosyltransferase involved in LPS biosynthesis
MSIAPIVLFVFNRPNHTKQTVESLTNNLLAKDSDLIIYSDGPRNIEDEHNVEEVREYIRRIDGFKTLNIIESERNKGLAKSIIFGVSEVIKKYGKCIVLEDDMVFSNNFLSYMNDALSVYENKCDIYSVTGYSPNLLNKCSYENDVFLSKRPSSWGWGTWKNRWEEVDWDLKEYNEFKKSKSRRIGFAKLGDDVNQSLHFQMKGYIDSWAIIWAFHHYINNAYCLYPVLSKLKNIGTDGSGTHFKSVRNNLRNVIVDSGKSNTKFNKDLMYNEEIENEFISCNHRWSRLKKTVRRIKTIYLDYKNKRKNDKENS